MRVCYLLRDGPAIEHTDPPLNNILQEEHEEAGKGVSTHWCNVKLVWVWSGHMELNISSTDLLPFPTWKTFTVNTLLDNRAGQYVEWARHVNSSELNVSFCLDDAPGSHRGCNLALCPVLAFHQGLRSARPRPLRILSRQFAQHKPAFTLRYLPLTDSCRTHWGFLVLQTQMNAVSHVASGCQPNYCR